MKRALLAATAMLVTSFNPVIVTPAFAQADPVVDPQQFCEDQLRPNDPNSEFQVEALSVSDSGWVNDGAAYPDPDPSTGPAGDPEGYGTPSYSTVFLSDSYFRNGGSPNVWAMATATITYPQTRQLWNFLQDQTDTVTFGCHVFKYEGADNHLVEPPGLQTTGNQTVDHQTISAGMDYVVTNEPFIIEGATVHALICISPNNVTKGKPGTWTGKNGFNAADCPAASIAAGGTVPSDNAPNI
jgi:hypothetical protein